MPKSNAGDKTPPNKPNPLQAEVRIILKKRIENKNCKELKFVKILKIKWKNNYSSALFFLKFQMKPISSNLLTRSGESLFLFNL